MTDVEDYRRYVVECLALAQQADTAQDRTRLLEIAHAFNELAVRLAGRSPDPP